MSSNLFNYKKTKLCNNILYWHQQKNVVGMLGLLLEKKITWAIRMLAYGVCADQCTEITRIGESTTIKCLKKLCDLVVEHYKACYFRSPNTGELARLLQNKNFHEWLEVYIACIGNGRIIQQHDKSRTKVVRVDQPLSWILEAMASYYTWIRDNFIGTLEQKWY